MKALLSVAVVFFICCSVHGQKDNLVVRYDFVPESHPLNKIFYLRVYIDNVLADSTKPHKPSASPSSDKSFPKNVADNIITGAMPLPGTVTHNLVLPGGCHQVRVEGVVKDKINGVEKLVTVFDWSSDMQADKDKARVKLELDERYSIVGNSIYGACSENEPKQKTMKLDSALRANSERFSFKKTKMAFTVGGRMEKFQFGDYQVIETKSGFESSLTNSRWFKKVQTKESKHKPGFQLANNNKDTIDANFSAKVDEAAFAQNYLLLKTKSSLRKDDISEKDQLLERGTALIHISDFAGEWAMIFVSYFPGNKTGELNKYGFLTNDNTLIEIKEVRLWDEGVKNKTNYQTGFEFYLDGVAIAAIQCPNDPFEENFVWFRDNQDAQIRNVLAGAMIACYNQFGNPFGLK